MTLYANKDSAVISGLVWAVSPLASALENAGGVMPVCHRSDVYAELTGKVEETAN